MADVTPSRINLPLPGTQFRAAVSEYIAQTLAGAVNFQNYFAYAQKEFFINGNYSVVTAPQYGVDGLAVFEFDAQIIDVWMFNLVAGTAGTTELDIQIATSPGGSFTSIFTTTPKISYTAGDNVWVGAPTSATIGPAFTYPAYSPPSGTTAPVLNAGVTTLIPAFTAVRLDILSSQTNPQNAGILLHYRNA